jgi:hypothetical protein
VAEPFRRPVSAIEKGYLAAAPLVPPFAIQLVVEGAGAVEPATLRAAVAVVAAASRGTGLRRRGGSWVDTNRAPPVVAAELPLDLEDPRLRAPLDPRNGPTCEILVAPAAVIFRAAHAVMDARATVHWATDVFRALRGEPPQSNPSTQTDHSVRRSVVARPPWVRTPLQWPNPLGRPAANRAYRWRRRTVAVSPHAAVAGLATVFAGLSGRPARIMVPVDLRRHLKGPLAGGNLSLPIFLTVEPGELWPQVHRRLLAGLHRREELARTPAEPLSARTPTAMLRAGLSLAERLSRRSDRQSCSAILSDLGRFDLAAFSTAGFRARTVYALPTHAPFVPVSVTIARSGGHTELLMSYADGPGTDHEATAFLDAAVAALREAPNPASP